MDGEEASRVDVIKGGLWMSSTLYLCASPIWQASRTTDFLSAEYVFIFDLSGRERLAPWL